jgi:hypothetical protein
VFSSFYKPALRWRNYCTMLELMPILQCFDNARGLMYFDDHPPPHVHVKIRDGRDCTVGLDSFEIRGRIAEREIREAVAWIISNQDFLLDE